MSASEQIDELLLYWEELRDQGRTVTVEELCQQYPELTDAVRCRIRALEAVYRVPNGMAPQAETQAGEAGPAHFPGGLPQVPGYDILAVLGHGGMGIVYKARHRALQRDVALKMILTGPHASTRDIRRFRSEAEMVARLQHPNIIQIYEVGELDGRPYLALELVEGGSFADRLKGEPLAAAAAAELVETLARAMHYAHQRGIVHRDLKPGNILLGKDEGGWMKDETGKCADSSFIIQPSSFTPKITDFGLAKRLDVEGGQTQTGAVLGTPSYMAPEQASGKTRAIGPATDIYALGAILYELLTGRPPFLGATPLETILQVSAQDPPAPRTLNPRLDRDLETICLKCLEKEPRDRYASAAALADDLHRYRNGDLIQARGLTLVNRVARTLNRDEQIKRFHVLETTLGRIALVPFVTHALAFALWHELPNYGPAVLLTSLANLMVLMAAIVWTAWHRAPFSSEASSRHFWSIRLGHFLGMVLVVVLCWQLGTPEHPWNPLTVYPFWTIITGLTFFPLGSNFWGRLYLFGLMYYAAVPLMGLNLEWAPVELGFLVTVSLSLLTFHLKKLENEARQTGEGESAKRA